MPTSWSIDAIILVLVLLLIIDGSVSSGTAQVASKHPSSGPLPPSTSIAVRTDSYAYVVGTPIRVSGLTTEPMVGVNVTLVPKKAEWPFPLPEQIPARVITQTNKDGSFAVVLTSPSQPAYYKVYANTSKGYSFTSIEVQDLFFTRTAFMLYIGGGIGFGGLMAVLYIESTIYETDSRPTVESSDNQPSVVDETERAADERKRASTRTRLLRRYSRLEALRFVFLSILAITPIAAFALTDVQIAPNSPLGLIIRQGPGSSQNSTLAGSQWLINIGGVPPDYKSGIQIPVNVFIFGILGGYLRFLYYTSQKGPSRTNGAAAEESQKGAEDTDVFYATLKDLALFLLSPLLAMAVWLVLFEAGMNSILTLAAVSFSVGLVTREVVQALIDFVKSKLSPPTSVGAAGLQSSG